MVVWFENDTAWLEILIGGYTDRPWYFKTEDIGLNALQCQVAFDNNKTGRNFVMWDEILQTDEIITIRDGMEQILSGIIEKFIFHSEYESFAIAIWEGKAGFETLVQVQNIDGNIREQFCLERTALSENYNYLKTCCEKYPVRN